jgi:hypothetical protein
LASRRSGFYFAVKKEGLAQTGDSIELLSRDPIGHHSSGWNAPTKCDNNAISGRRMVSPSLPSPLPLLAPDVWYSLG